MKISVRASHYTNEQISPNLRGYATIKFDDEYVLEAVKIMENPNNNQLFVSLPSIQVRAKDENGSYIKNEDGEYKKTFKEIFHPITAEARLALNSAVLNSYENSGEGNSVFTDVTFGDEKFTPTKAYMNKSNIKNLTGIGSLIFSDSFVLENVQVKSGKSGEYFDSPKRKVKSRDKNSESEYEYVEFFHPITKETYNQMSEFILNALEESRTNQSVFSDDTYTQLYSQDDDDELDLTNQSGRSR